MTIPIIGGKSDSQTCEAPASFVQFERGGETYIRIEWKDEAKATHTIYMLAGMIPAQAQKIYDERYGKA